MQELADALNSQRELFSTLHAYPTSTFPAYSEQQQNLVFALLWKKLDPRGEEWIQKSLQDSSEQNGSTEQGSLAADQVEEVWDWAGKSSREFVEDWLDKKTFEDTYTVAERKAGKDNVVTGIKRDLDWDSEDSEDEGDEDEDQMEEDKKPEEITGPVPNGFDPTKPAIPLESLLRFGSGGEMNPPGPNR